MLLLTLLFGCPGEGDGPSIDTGPVGCLDVPATVSIGETLYDDAGLPSWAPMAEGSEQIMVHGPQGGWHVLAAAWIEHTGEIVQLDYTITLPAQNVTVSDSLFRVLLSKSGDCAGYYAGMYGILDVNELAEGDVDTPPEVLGGETLRLSMTVTDEAGRTAEDTVDVVAALDAMDRDDAEGDTSAGL